MNIEEQIRLKAVQYATGFGAQYADKAVAAVQLTLKANVGALNHMIATREGDEPDEYVGTFEQVDWDVARMLLIANAAKLMAAAMLLAEAEDDA